MLSDFKVLTFDCYGTLIDWEAGILAAIRPWLTAQRFEISDADLLVAFGEAESAQEAACPDALYPDILSGVHGRLAARWNLTSDADAAQAFGASVPDWPAFADSAEALARLQAHYKLVILSNIDRNSFAASNAKLGVTFDAVFTAQDIGSYKPDPANFRYMLEKLAEQDFAQGDILHTAQSLYHDHVPAKTLGFTTCWIDRRAGKDGGATKAIDVSVEPDYRFETLLQMAEAREAEAA